MSDHGRLSYMRLSSCSNSSRGHVTTTRGSRATTVAAVQSYIHPNMWVDRLTAIAFAKYQFQPTKQPLKGGAKGSTILTGVCSWSWLIIVRDQFWVSFSFNYKNQVLYDIIPLTALHPLLGWLWLFDLNVEHRGRYNTYSFHYDGIKFTFHKSMANPMINRWLLKCKVLVGNPSPA